MSVSFNEIVKILKVGCTGYYEIDMIWIDYVYLENQSAIVSDATTHGAWLEQLPVPVERGQRFKLQLTAMHERKGRYKFKATSMTILGDENTSIAMGPSFAVILSCKEMPSKRPPFQHEGAVLMIQGISSANYIGLKYMLRHVFQSPTNKEKEWTEIFAYCFKWGPTFRLIELESISSWSFIHAHDFVCDKLPRDIRNATDAAHVQRLRDIATQELQRRYAAGERDRDPKVDLPSGKCDIIESALGFRFETPLEACTRELEEETGIPLTDLVFLGSSTSQSATLHVQSKFFYFSVRSGATIRMTPKDCYVASSWTMPVNIQAYMIAVEATEMRWGRFDSLRRIGLAEDVFEALVTVTSAPGEAERHTWNLKTKSAGGKCFADDEGDDTEGEMSRKVSSKPLQVKESPRTVVPPVPPVVAAKVVTPEVVSEAPKLVAKKKTADIIVVDDAESDGAGEDKFDDKFMQSFAKLNVGGRGGGGAGGGRGGGRR